jgi:hypothetical protein
MNSIQISIENRVGSNGERFRDDKGDEVKATHPASASRLPTTRLINKYKCHVGEVDLLSRSRRLQLNSSSTLTVIGTKKKGVSQG